MSSLAVTSGITDWRDSMSDLMVALTGNPNTGKSTIFCELTGMRQKIGNWPGVTVDKKVGYTKYNDCNITVVDLPGTYSVNARSPEEKIVIDFLMNNPMDVVMDIVDSSNVERNLFLTVQLLEKGVPVIFTSPLAVVAVTVMRFS